MYIHLTMVEVWNRNLRVHILVIEVHKEFLAELCQVFRQPRRELQGLGFPDYPDVHLLQAPEWFHHDRYLSSQRH